MKHPLITRIQSLIRSFTQSIGKFFPFVGGNSKLKDAIIKQHDLTDCGATCLASVAAYYNLTIPVARIRQYASTDKKGTNVLGLIEAAGRLGFNAKGVKADFNQLPHAPVPVIAHVIVKQILHHYVVVYRVTDTIVEVMDPARGELIPMSYQEFKSLWTGVLILIQPGETFMEGNEKISVSKRFRYLLKPHRSVLFQVLLGAIIYTLLGLSTSIFLQKIVDNVLPEGNRNLLNLMGVVMIGILFFRVVINHSKSLLTIKTGQQIDARLILGYYKHLLRLPQQFFDNMRVGEIISRINDAVKIRVFINDVLIGFAVNMFILLFSFVLMFTYYWKLALIMICVVPLYAVIYYFSNKMNKSTQRKLMESSAELEAQLVESINSVSTIKRFGLEDFTNMRTETRFVGMLQSVYKSNTNALWIGDFSGFVASVFTIILLWAGSLFVLNSIITPGELLSFYAIIGYFTGPVASLIGMNKTIQDASIAADRLFEIMDIERESIENRAVLTPEMIGDIHFKNVHFRYGTRVKVFEGLDLTIPKGKITAVVGESGSGKTTLLSLLQNIYTIDSGNILLGGFDIKYLTNDSLRQMVSAVPQDVHLFAGNVISNIAVGEFEPDMKKVVAICQELDIMRFIENLPNGFNTYIGENGTSLSGGQRQRIAIARALYRDPEILILDEATSSLDSKSEQYIQLAVQSLRKKNKTIIIIAHRLSTVMNADQIVVLEQGKLIEHGNHKKLLTKKGKYFEMWRQQFPSLESVN